MQHFQSVFHPTPLFLPHAQEARHFGVVDTIIEQMCLAEQLVWYIRHLMLIGMHSQRCTVDDDCMLLDNRFCQILRPYHIGIGIYISVDNDSA